METKPPIQLTDSVIVFAEPSFAVVSAQDRDAILAVGKKRVIKSGGYLYRRGDQPDGISVILDGLLRITGVSREGEEFIIDLCGSGFWVGEIAVLANCPRSLDAIAEVDTEVLYFDRETFERLLSEFNSLARGLLVLEAVRFQRALEWAQQSATLPLEALLAKRLSMFAHRDPSFAVLGRTSEFKVTQLTLARLVGTTRQRINQVLQDWETNKLIKTSRGGLQILELEKIEAKFSGL